MIKAPKKQKKADENRPIPETDWFQHTINARGLTLRQVATALGIAENKGSQIIRGTRRVQIHEIGILARVLRVAPELIVRKLGFDWLADVVPIVGEVTAIGDIDDLDPCEYAPMPEPAERELAAVRLREARAHWPAGTCFYFTPADFVMDSSEGRLCVARLGDSEATRMLGVPRGIRTGAATFTPIGGEPIGPNIFGDVMLEAASPVLWVWLGS